jgi:hypothetical protein
MKLVIDDVPMRVDGWEIDRSKESSVFHLPNRALAGCGIFPNQIGLTVAAEVCSTRNMPFLSIQIVRSPLVVFSHTKSA